MLFQGGVALTYERAHAHEVTMTDTVTNNTLADWLNADVRCDMAELPWKKKELGCRGRIEFTYRSKLQNEVKETEKSDFMFLLF